VEILARIQRRRHNSPFAAATATSQPVRVSVELPLQGRRSHAGRDRPVHDLANGTLPAAGVLRLGFIQPVDFFGTGPRIPMIAVSPFSTGGHISHMYNEHSSFVKFIERNWPARRTLAIAVVNNLPNPVQDQDNAYVPRNMPASATCSTVSIRHHGG